MIIKLKKGDSYIEVDTELNYDEVDTITKIDDNGTDEMIKTEDEVGYE